MNRLAIVMTCWLVLASSLGAKELIVGVPQEGAPLVYIKDGELKGVIGDLSKILFDNPDTTMKLSVVPFARLFGSIATGELDVALRVLASEERRKQAFYSEPVITEYQLIVVAKGKAFKLEKISDLYGKKLATISGFLYPTLDGKKEITYDPAPDNITNVKKVIAGRVDAAVVNSIFGLKALSEAKLLDQVEVLPVAVAPVPLGIALSFKAFTKDDLESLNKKIETVLASPKWKEIRQVNQISEWDRAYPLAKK